MMMRALTCTINQFFAKYKKAKMVGHFDIGDIGSAKADSQRYNVFRKSIECCVCGIRGKYFALEKHPGKENMWHFNLYGTDPYGKEMLMTKDHIVPISQGGKNTLDNYQTMCQVCNSLRGQSKHLFGVAIVDQIQKSSPLGRNTSLQIKRLKFLSNINVITCSDTKFDVGNRVILLLNGFNLSCATVPAGTKITWSRNHGKISAGHLVPIDVLANPLQYRPGDDVSSEISAYINSDTSIPEEVDEPLS